MNKTDRDLRKLNRVLNAGCCVALLSIGAAVCFIGASSLQKMGESKSQQAKYLRERLRKANLEEIEFKRLNKKLATSMEVLEARKTQIPAKPDFEGFSVFVEQNAIEAGLRLVELRRGEVATVTDTTYLRMISELPATVVCSGDYSAICRFAEATQTMPASVKINKLQVSSTNLKKSPPTSDSEDEGSLLTIKFVLQFDPEVNPVQQHVSH